MMVYVHIPNTYDLGDKRGRWTATRMGQGCLEMGDLSPSHGPSAVYFRAYSWAKPYVLETTHEINGLRSSHAMGIQP